MTAGTTSNDLAGVLAQTRSVLLDFDGPVCPIFADGRNAAIASVMRDRLRRHNVDIPAEIEEAWDPLHVLWFVYRRGPANLTAVVDDTFVEAEINAALTAQPTPHAHDAIRACHEVGRPVVVVSNNAAAAIEAYLNRHQLAGDITASRRPHTRTPRSDEATPRPREPSPPHPPRDTRLLRPGRRLGNRHRGSPQDGRTQHRIRQGTRPPRKLGRRATRRSDRQHGRPRDSHPRQPTRSPSGILTQYRVGMVGERTQLLS